MPDCNEEEHAFITALTRLITEHDLNRKTMLSVMLGCRLLNKATQDSLTKEITQTIFSLVEKYIPPSPDIIRLVLERDTKEYNAHKK